jgi:hypothetical protein
VIHELTVQDWVHTHDVFIDLWLDLVRHVVINGVSHVFGQDIFEAFLVEHVVIEDFNQDIQEAFIFICVETDFEYLISTRL